MQLVVENNAKSVITESLNSLKESGKKSFAEVMEAILSRDEGDVLGQKQYEELQTLKSQLSVQGSELSPADLLQYQITAQRFGLRIELLSKLAESLNASSRKIQQQG